ncbi:hypothetical protein ABEB36_013715 [Hypothenemus hampei]|uniref:Odorant receptor n=1 Tax=Hypothenemus hampei TaxID=57062 RepID=A0ABD1E605_HYPHA
MLGNTVELFDLLLYIFAYVTLIARNIQIQTPGIQRLLLKMINEEKRSFEENTKYIRDIFENSRKFLNRILKFLTVSALLTLAAHFLANVIQFINHKNDLDNKPMPSPGIWYPFNGNKYYFLTILISSFQSFSGSCIHFVCNGTLFALLIYITTEQKALNSFIKNLQLCSETEQGILEKLRKIIIKHQIIISFINELGVRLRLLFLIDFCMVSVIIALNVFEMFQLPVSSSTKMFNLLFIGIELFQLFSISWFANEIRIQSIELCDTLYEIEWYECPNKVKQIIFFMIMRSQKPLTLYIGPFYVLTNSAVIRTLRATYSYITLLLVMTQNKEN